jgi:hypothetical protein
VVYEAQGDRRTYYRAPECYGLEPSTVGQYAWDQFAFTWPSDAFNTYLWIRYKIRADVTGPMYYGGVPLEDLDWDACPVLDITDFAYSIHELVMFDQLLA